MKILDERETQIATTTTNKQRQKGATRTEALMKGES